MRHENKFVYEKHYYHDIIDKIMISPFFFREIYHERKVNNIYLDTHLLSNYHDNLSGIQNRTKHRIRWYGEGTRVASPILEYKIKNGRLGYKKHFHFPPFVMDKSFNYHRYKKKIKDGLDTDHSEYALMVDEISMEIPTLHNTYRRRYFLSGDGKYRLTIDTDLTFSSMSETHHRSFGFTQESIVVELKYENEDIEGAAAILQSLGLRLSTNSKYVTGITGLYYS